MSELSLAERLAGAAGLTAEERDVAQMYVQRLHNAGVVSIAQLIDRLGDVRADRDVRGMACRIVAWLRVLPAAAVVARIFDETDDDGLVWEAANTLVRLRPPEVAVTLSEMLQRGTREKQAAAAWVLGWLGEKAAVPSLLTVAMDASRDINVRGHATEALGVLQAGEAVQSLVDLLGSESPHLRYWAAYSLGQIADPVAIPALERAASSETAVISVDQPVRQEMLDALAAIRAK